jgi:hypothetical protein
MSTCKFTTPTREFTPTTVPEPGSIGHSQSNFDRNAPRKAAGTTASTSRARTAAARKSRFSITLSREQVTLMFQLFRLIHPEEQPSHSTLDLERGGKAFVWIPR